MAASAALGLRRIEAIHYYVHDLARSRRFYTEKLGFEEVAESGPALTQAGRQHAIVFQSGACRVVCSTPVGKGGRADRYLAKHPDGIGSIVFEVEDAERAFSFLEGRGGTPIQDLETSEGPSGRFKTFVIATPFGDTTFRFVEREQGRAARSSKEGYAFYPGFEAREPRAEHAGLGFLGIDHVTSNFETMAPALLWLEHVLGFERFWQVEFHTDDVRRVDDHGSGLRSVVMYDPTSGIKFANNEPYRPNFKASQINVFHEEHRGDGVQHVALGVADITATVRTLRERGVEFMPTPEAYYRALPERLRALSITDLDSVLKELEALQILVDGDGAGRYLLQIFLKDSALLYGSPEAGPFFYEIIERRGDDGFGAGNFRALFESIERTQLGGGSR
jgi:4-hydroxyphenylpyruvate dioxygenase